MDPTPASPPPHDGPAPARRGLMVLAAIAGVVLLLAMWGLDRAKPPPSSAGPAPVAPATKAKVKGKVAIGGSVVQGPPVPRAKAPADARNVVLFILTAVRRDAVTPYGAPPDRTPRLAQLAAAGARFDDALTASPFARSSAIALLTAQNAAVLDAVEPAPTGDNRVLSPQVKTLPERLRAAGWSTCGIAANFNYNSDTGIAQGFDRYRDAPRNSFAPAARREADAVVADALGLLDGRPEERPFYLQVELLDAHPPWRAEADRAAPNAYAAAVRAVDAAVGTVLDALEQDGHTTASDTYVVVVADHGSGNGDPPAHGKAPGRLLFPTSVEVPWIIAGPDVAKGQRIGGLASLTDLSPTLLDLLGLPPFTGVDGQSWAALVRGQGNRTTRTRVFSDTWHFNVSRASVWTSDAQCQKDFGSVDAVDGFATACFDRVRDRRFETPRSDPALLAELDRWRAEVSTHVSGLPSAE